MATFNVLELDMICPRCGKSSHMEAEFRFGFLNLDRYRIGDRLRWEGNRRSTPKVRPEGGNYEGEGYIECPNCHRDFWITIKVRNDVIEGGEVDPSRPGYIDPPE